ncbi:hypothetical protein GCM10008956_15210 [Deinococcus arenae]|uniref:Uncharacterized protein n=1 Tax=Deinococcus arenae TaxID=1452751 RepID=A0A8H9GMT8_9DEIO|nr:hypothetical protein [Deinococcus arenae]GGM39717.1 hypothetical protein GCM10008956_15210 [Deinococcus arenae]
MTTLLDAAREIVSAWDWAFHHRISWTPSPREVAAEAELGRIQRHVVREYVKLADERGALFTLAVQARDARTSADRRAALDALERAALALGGTP